MAHSGKTTNWAPSFAARRVQDAMRSRLPATSPSRGSVWTAATVTWAASVTRSSLYCVATRCMAEANSPRRHRPQVNRGRRASGVSDEPVELGDDLIGGLDRGEQRVHAVDGVV